MQVQTLDRVFKYNSVQLADPSPAFTLIQVRDFYANTYPEIISAEIEGPEVIGNKTVYTFRRAVGTKGIDPAELGLHSAPPPAPPARPAAVETFAAVSARMALDIERDMGLRREMPEVGNRLQSDIAAAFSRPVPMSHCPNVPMRKIVSDLAQLERIGWFNGTGDGLAAVRIRCAQAEYDHTPGYDPSVSDCRLFRDLHRQHCSRESAAP